MCTYSTEKIEIVASAKGPDGWFRATTATVYYDHPVHYMAEHALMVDIMNLDIGPRSRVALEMPASDAREFANAILRALDSIPVGLKEHDSVTRDVE